MPYPTLDSLPDWVKEMPKHAQEIYQASWNAAYEEYKDEGKAAATAITAVKTKFEKSEDGKWKAKEAVDINPGELSSEDKRRLIQSELEKGRNPEAIATKLSPWLRDIFDTEIVYELGGQLFKAPYTIDDTGKVTIGTPTKVIAVTQYKATEVKSLQNEIVQLSGFRAIDASDKRLVKSLSKEATVQECEDCIKWLKEEAVVKTEDGVKFPAEAFAYVPDPEKPSEWKLRIWEDPQKKVTRKQLGAAAAALSPGGFRGQRVDIPSGDISKVKAKLRSAYRSLDVKDEEMPKWVKEAEMVRELVAESCAIDIEEVTKEKIAKGIVPVRFLVPGFNVSKEKFYTPDAIKDAVKVFEGVKMYADHPTDEDDKKRPERSIKDWAATLKNCKTSTSGNACGEAYINAGWLKEKAQALYEQGDLNQLAVSILGVGKGSKGEVEGHKTTIIEGIVKGRSVDFVTEPGAGGRAGLMESADISNDIDVISLDRFKKERPDLVEALTVELSETFKPKQEDKMAEEKKVEEVQKELDTTKAALKEATDQLAAEKSARAKADAKAKIDKAIAEAKLPEVSKERLLAQFKDAESDKGLAEAIKAETEYVAKIAETGRVKDLGNTTPDTDATKAALREAVKKANPTWSDKMVDDFVKGR